MQQYFEQFVGKQQRLESQFFCFSEAKRYTFDCVNLLSLQGQCMAQIDLCFRHIESSGELYAKGIAASLEDKYFKSYFLITMDCAQKPDLLFFYFFINVVVNKWKAYSFLVINYMYLK